jgi:acetylornithine deacetylase/succinyl-diaminopimelate desuccinylase-like protein
MPGMAGRRASVFIAVLGIVLSAALAAQTGRSSANEPDWPAVAGETLRHFQALLRLDTSNPPGNERLAVEYLRQALEGEGIPVTLFALEPDRPNLVARLKGSGRRRPLLLMGHTDVVGVDPSKWRFPPFSAARDSGYIYGRGSLDDRPHLVAGLMTMLMLKRLNVPLDRDVIFLAEAGEEGAARVGIDFMVRQHYPEIDAEYCFAEVGETVRVGGRVRYAAIETSEKIPRPIELTARGTSGHASIPLPSNAVVHLARAVAAVGGWKTPIRLNETTREYFSRLAGISSPDDAARYRSLLMPSSPDARAADAWLMEHVPAQSSMLRTSISPTIVNGGFRSNIIPSEAGAALDVRMLPDEDPAQFLAALKGVIGDSAIQVAYLTSADERTVGEPTRLDSDAFRAIEASVTRHYGTVTLPMMLNGATDMASLRARGMQCYGFGPAVDAEDAPQGFGPHSDQERIVEAELHRFVQVQWEVVTELAGIR